MQGDSGSDNWQSAKRYLDLNDRVDWFEDGRPAVMPAEFYSSQFYVDRAIDYYQRYLQGDVQDRAEVEQTLRALDQRRRWTE